MFHVNILKGVFKMNIDKLRSAVIEGQKTTLVEQNKAYDVYEKRTGESVANITNQIQTQINELEKVK